MTRRPCSVLARHALAASVLAASVPALSGTDIPAPAASFRDSPTRTHEAGAVEPRAPQPPAASVPVPAEWLTPAEAAGFGATPSYDETLAFLRRVVAASPEMRLTFYGRSTIGPALP